MTQSDQPSLRLSLSKLVLGVELFDVIENRRITTYQREGSRCSFSEQISYKEFELTLRLDWGDTKDDEPTLDLDVVQIYEDGVRKKIRAAKLVSHHTNLSAYLAGSLSPQTYDVEFQGLTMRLVARKTYAMSAGVSMYICDPASE